MKKRFIILPILAALSLAGCDLFNKKDSGGDGDGGGKQPAAEWDINPEFLSGTEEEKNAILRAVNDMSPCVNKVGTDIFPDKTYSLSEDDGDYIKLTTVQKVGSLFVNYTWNVPDQISVEAFSDSDESHKIIEVSYPGFGNPNRELKWSLDKIECGSAVTGKAAEWKVTVTAESHPHEVMTIAQINKVTDGTYTSSVNGKKTPSRYDLVNYDDEQSNYFIPNADDPNPDYRYVRVKGKVIYYAPDGNWLLIADGDQVMEVYAGSAYNLVPKEYPAISKEYVEVFGNLSQYKGNIQIGFVTKILALSETQKSEITEPTMSFASITSDFITNNLELNASEFPKADYPGQKIAVDGFANSLGQITGTIDTASIKDGDGAAATATSVKAAGRFTFDVSLTGGKKVTVAYDYHTDKTGSVGIFSALQAKLKTGGSITVKGTMRYNGNDTAPFDAAGNAGTWNVVPFAPAHIG